MSTPLRKRRSRYTGMSWSKRHVATVIAVVLASMLLLYFVRIPTAWILLFIKFANLALPFILGYGVSLIISGIFIQGRLKYLSKGHGEQVQPDILRLAAEIGTVEAFIYTTSIVTLGSMAGAIIGAWLLLKAAVEWKTEETKNYYIYLIGNGYSLGFSLVGALIIIWLR